MSRCVRRTYTHTHKQKGKGRRVKIPDTRIFLRKQYLTNRKPTSSPFFPSPIRIPFAPHHNGLLGICPAGEKNGSRIWLALRGGEVVFRDAVRQGPPPPKFFLFSFFFFSRTLTLTRKTTVVRCSQTALSLSRVARTFSIFRCGQTAFPSFPFLSMLNVSKWIWNSYFL